MTFKREMGFLVAIELVASRARQGRGHDVKRAQRCSNIIIESVCMSFGFLDGKRFRPSCVCSRRRGYVQ
jgi:hypothetical protein